MRKRLLNPDLFRDEVLAEVPIEARYLYTGLWCIADREGRLEDRPMRIMADVFPYDSVGVPSVDLWLTLLCPRWIYRYIVDDTPVIQLVNFLKHQKPHIREQESRLPAPPEGLPKADLGLPKADPPIALGPPRLALGAPRLPVYGIRYTVPPIVPQREKSAKVASEQSAWFDQFWEEIWLKVGKGGAWGKFRAKVKDEATFAAVMAGVKRDAPIQTRKERQFQVHPKTWLTEERWTDEANSGPPLDDGPHYISADDMLAWQAAKNERDRLKWEASQRQGPPDAA